MIPLAEQDFVFDDGPLMLALIQMSFTQSPEIIQRITDIKAGLAKIGLPIAEQKEQMAFTMRLSGGPNTSITNAMSVPGVSQNMLWFFTTPDRRRVVAVTQKSVVLYDAAYRQFKDFRELVADIARLVEVTAGTGCFLTAVALRYVNAFAAGGNPSPLIVPSLHGLPVSNIQTNHFHHQYSFWCDTATGGKLVANLKTVHGNQLLPQDAMAVGIALDDKFALDKDAEAIQLDIHETVQKKQLREFSVDEVQQLAAQMRINIRSVFMAMTTKEAHATWRLRHV